MLRLILMIAGAVCIYYWFKTRRPGSVIASGNPRQSARSVRLGFIPADELNDEFAGAPEPALLAAFTAARSGEWRPAADLLADGGTDWERRSMYAESLSGIAAKDDRWLLAWEQARHDDPDAAVVRARATVGRAWELRGGRSASRTSRAQFEGFHSTLARSREDIARAARLNPHDPTPYITEIWAALGLGYPHAEMHRLWAEVTARAPHHYEAHFSALQYWCAKWRGSDDLARAFAAHAASDAPLGSLMTAFPLIAWFEAHLDDTVKASTYRSPELTALVDAALADAAAAPADHPRLGEVRHLLAYFLHQQGRHDAALEQFRLVDGYVNALPWSYYGKRFYGAIRETTVRRSRSRSRTPDAPESAPRSA